MLIRTESAKPTAAFAGHSFDTHLLEAESESPVGSSVGHFDSSGKTDR